MDINLKRLKRQAIVLDPRLDDRRLDHLLGLAISNINIPAHRQHKFREDCFFMKYTELRSAFGVGYKEYLSSSGLISIAGDYSRTDGATYPYTLTDKFFSILLSLEIAQLERLRHGDTSGIPYCNPRKLAIATRDTRGDHKRKTLMQIPAFVPLDPGLFSGVHKLYDQHLAVLTSSTNNAVFSENIKKSQRILASIQLILMRLRIDKNTGRLGTIESYTESKSGRLYANGIALQNLPKALRRALFIDCTEWDFDTCHPTLMRSLAAKSGIETPGLSFYIDQKNAMRERIASGTGLDISHVKRSLTALMYGASTDAKPGNTLYETLGDDALARLNSNKVFSLVAQEVKKCSKVIVEQHQRNKTIINPLGKTMPVAKLPERKQLAHILQGYEAKMLDIVVRDAGRGEPITHDIRLLQHDGWTYVGDVMPTLASSLEHIEETLGVPMSVSHEYINPISHR